MSSKRRYTILVFFTTGKTLKHGFWSMSWQWKIRLLKHQPGPMYRYFLGWFTKVLTLSKYAHVCPAFDGVVLELAGSLPPKFWGLIEFAQHYPAVDGMYVIHTRRPVDMRRYENYRRPSTAWRSYLKLFTLGLIQIGGDCVDQTKNALAQAGVRVPRRVICPGGLHKWLRGRGYAWTKLTSDSPTDVRGAVD